VSRRGVVPVAAAAAVVVAVQGLAGAPLWDSRPAAPVSPHPTASPTTSGPNDIPFAPSIPDDRIQPVWDPRNVAELGFRDLGLPQDLPGSGSGSVRTAVALLDDGQQQTVVVGGDGATQALDLPPGLGRQRTVRLSPDGSRVAAVGISGFFWRELDGGDWQRVEVPDSVMGEGIEVTWFPDSRSLVLRSHLPGVRVDLETGEQLDLPELDGYVSWGADPGGC
jgi:hypothetical protein